MDLEQSSLLYRHPAWYDQVQSDPEHTTAKRCEELINRHGPAEARTLLDFGCSTGQDLAWLANRFEAVGVDLQPRMIAYARQVHPGLDLRVGDMRNFRLGHSVDVITCLGNALASLHRNSELHAAFATFTAHAPRHNPHPRHRRNGDTRNRDPTLTGPVQTADLRAEVTVSYQWQLRTQIQTMHRHWLLADGTQAPDCIRRRVIFPRELELYLNLAGFELIELSDNHTTSHGELTGPTAYATAQADSPDARVPPWYAACSASARSWQ